MVELMLSLYSAGWGCWGPAFPCCRTGSHLPLAGSGIRAGQAQRLGAHPVLCRLFFFFPFPLELQLQPRYCFFFFLFFFPAEIMPVFLRETTRGSSKLSVALSHFRSSLTAMNSENLRVGIGVL